MSNSCVCGQTVYLGTALTTWTGLTADGHDTAYSTSSDAERASECDSSCASYQPVFGNELIFTASTAALGASIVPLDGGGLAVAWVQIEMFANMSYGVLHYTECDAHCSDGGTWTDVVVDEIDGAGAPPQMAISAAGVRGIAFNGNEHDAQTDGVLYAECAGTCTKAASWTEASPQGNQGADYETTRPGFAMINEPDGGLLRALSDGESYLDCTENCTPGLGATGGWSAVFNQIPGDGNGDDVIAVRPSGLPRIAIAACPFLEVNDCLQQPCTDAANWRVTELTADEACAGKIDFVADSAGLGHLVYSSDATPAALMLTTETLGPGGGSSWSQTNLTLCGGADLLGTLPALAVTPNDGVRVHFQYAGMTDGGTSHAMYLLGP